MVTKIPLNYFKILEEQMKNNQGIIYFFIYLFSPLVTDSIPHFPTELRIQN